ALGSAVAELGSRLRRTSAAPATATSASAPSTRARRRLGGSTTTAGERPDQAPAVPAAAAVGDCSVASYGPAGRRLCTPTTRSTESAADCEPNGASARASAPTPG